MLRTPSYRSTVRFSPIKRFDIALLLNKGFKCEVIFCSVGLLIERLCVGHLYDSLGAWPGVFQVGEVRV